MRYLSLYRKKCVYNSVRLLRESRGYSYLRTLKELSLRARECRVVPGLQESESLER